MKYFRMRRYGNISRQRLARQPDTIFCVTGRTLLWCNWLDNVRLPRLLFLPYLGRGILVTRHCAFFLIQSFYYTATLLHQKLAGFEADEQSSSAMAFLVHFFGNRSAGYEKNADIFTFSQ